MVKFLYRIYQLIIGLPILVILTIITALEVGIGTTIGNGHFWGYYPGHWWGNLILKLFLLPVKVEGRENLEKDQSYVFVANHQGSFDIFLIYGHLNRNFKWMMKQHTLCGLCLREVAPDFRGQAGPQQDPQDLRECP